MSVCGCSRDDDSGVRSLVVVCGDTVVAVVYTFVFAVHVMILTSVFAFVRTGHVCWRGTFRCDAVSLVIRDVDDLQRG